MIIKPSTRRLLKPLKIDLDLSIASRGKNYEEQPDKKLQSLKNINYRRDSFN